jgi:hypothetical protein
MSTNIKDFAYKKQAPTDAAVNGVLNGFMTWFLLSGFTSVPVLSTPGGDFSHSLLGTLVMPAVVLAFIISMVTSKMTINKRIKGEVTPSLTKGVKWAGRAFKHGIGRAILNVFIVYGLGGIILQFAPDILISRLAASIIVFLMAGILAYIESASAVLRTRSIQ